MKKLLPLALLLAPAFLFARDTDDSIVQWNRIVGVITAPNVDNPVAGISAGTLPWTTRQGRAHVNLATGEASFDVEGLVLIGGNATGTPGQCALSRGDPWNSGHLRRPAVPGAHRTELPGSRCGWALARNGGRAFRWRRWLTSAMAREHRGRGRATGLVSHHQEGRNHVSPGKHHAI